MIKKASEADIQRAILAYLATRRNIVFWRQNSGSFTAPAIRAIAAVLDKFGLGRKKHAITAAVKRAVGHYKCTSESGLPDITVVYKGVYVGIEVKTPTGRLTKDQKLMHKKMDKAGARYIVARSINDVKEYLDELEKEIAEKE